MRKQFVLYIVGVVVLLVCSKLPAQKTDTTNIQYIEKINKSIQQQSNRPTHNVSQLPKDRKIIVFPDIYYEFRIENLDKKSPIKLDYNKDVRKYIDLYLNERPEKVAEFLGLQEMYFPIFEEYLDKYNLPQELKYLPIIESGLNPLAQSSSGAMGLWQLLMNSSKLLGLEVNSFKDERCDPYLSTDAACRYLKYLYGIFNDWQLALAAYNGGPGEIRNAIMRSGGKTKFWEIQSYLPEQTKWYVPAFIAAVYLSNHAAEHGIVPKKALFSYSQTDTLMIHEATDFSKISEKTDIPIETIRFLNPVYRRNFIPDLEKPQPLVLPSEKILSFLKVENQIYSRTNDTLNYLDVLSAAGDTVGKSRTYYKVEKGDYLNKIAMLYGCTADNLKAWNNLNGNGLNKGQLLSIWLKRDSIIQTQNETINNKKAQYFYYTVKKGDTMWKIAERFKCDSINAIKLANNIKNEKDIKPGQKLKILVNN